MAKRHSRRGRAKLIGFGLDEADGQIRITRGSHFRLLNGKAATHQAMQNKAQEFLRRVQQRGLTMDNISRGECREILVEMGLEPDGNTSS